MIPDPAPERLTLPVLSMPSARMGFPLVATLAPVGMSLALWGITQSPASLLFALLGPLVAIGGLIDGRLSRRRSTRRELGRFTQSLERVRESISFAHERERAQLWKLVPHTPSGYPLSSAHRHMLWSGRDNSALPVSLGLADVPSRLELIGDDPPELLPPLRETVADVRANAAMLIRAPIVVDARAGVGIVGPPVMAAAVARAVALQLASLLSPAQTTIRAPATESWVSGLPHAAAFSNDLAYRFIADDSTTTVMWAPHRDELELHCSVVITVGCEPTVERHPSGLMVQEFHAQAVAQQRASGIAGQLAHWAATHNVAPASTRLPQRVDLGDLLDEIRASSPPAPPGGLAAPIGRDAMGVVIVDLVAVGPHAIVAGTTGSGKSELLVSWVLALAATHTSDELVFVLIDFKGGAAFAPLAGIPHVLATLSDLDARLTRRAIDSLRAELMRREHTLAEHAARSIDDLDRGVLPRLVIVVDEFAAVVAASPELHEVFADLAARGRSLGMHLILCTQRPSGVIRDAVLANVTLRVSLRVTDRGDSQAMVGTDAASRLPVEPRGRAVLVGSGAGDGTVSDAPREIQIAIAAPADNTRVRRETGASARRPWCDPLPARVSVDALPMSDTGVSFGLVDLPSEQRQPAAIYEPRQHGALLVTGAGGTGKTTALVTLAHTAATRGFEVIVVPARPADAWAYVAAELMGPTADPRLLLIDDIDLLVDRFDPDYRHEFLDMVTRLIRESSARQLGVVITAHRMAGSLSTIAGTVGSRLLLRQVTRDEHVLAGGDGKLYDPDARPGSGTWRGSVVQVAVVPEGVVSPAGDRLSPSIPQIVKVQPHDHRVLAVVTPRPRALIARLAATGAQVIEVGAGTTPNTADQVPDIHVSEPGRSTILIGDPDAWQAEWSLLTRARRELPIVLIGCTPSDHRTILRDRELPPPLAPEAGECWYADAGITLRARWSLPQ